MGDYNIKAILTANASQLIGGFREAQASVEQFRQSTTHVKSDIPAMIGGVGKAMTKGVTLPLAAIGGAAAIIKDRIKKCDIIAYEDLGAEAFRRLEVEDFPATVIIDSNGNNLYEEGVEEYLKWKEK